MPNTPEQPDSTTHEPTPYEIPGRWSSCYIHLDTLDDRTSFNDSTLSALWQATGSQPQFKISRPGAGFDTCILNHEDKKTDNVFLSKILGYLRGLNPNLGIFFE